VNRSGVEAMLWRHLPDTIPAVIDAMLAVIDAYAADQYGGSAERRAVLLAALETPAEPPVLPSKAELHRQALRRAHTAATGLRQAGFEVTGALGALEREYQREAKRQQRARHRKAAVPHAATVAA